MFLKFLINFLTIPLPHLSLPLCRRHHHRLSSLPLLCRLLSSVTPFPIDARHSPFLYTLALHYPFCNLFTTPSPSFLSQPSLPSLFPHTPFPSPVKSNQICDQISLFYMFSCKSYSRIFTSHHPFQQLKRHSINSKCIPTTDRYLLSTSYQFHRVLQQHKQFALKCI